MDICKLLVLKLNYFLFESWLFLFFFFLNSVRNTIWIVCISKTFFSNLFLTEHSIPNSLSILRNHSEELLILAIEFLFLISSSKLCKMFTIVLIKLTISFRTELAIIKRTKTSIAIDFPFNVPSLRITAQQIEDILIILFIFLFAFTSSWWFYLFIWFLFIFFQWFLFIFAIT